MYHFSSPRKSQSSGAHQQVPHQTLSQCVIAKFPMFEASNPNPIIRGDLRWWKLLLLNCQFWTKACNFEFQIYIELDGCIYYVNQLNRNPYPFTDFTGLSNIAGWPKPHHAPVAHSPASTKRRLPVCRAAKMSRKRASARATSDWNMGATSKLGILDQKIGNQSWKIRIWTESNAIFRKCGFNPQKLLIWPPKQED